MGRLSASGDGQAGPPADGESLESILCAPSQSLRIRICDALGRVLRTGDGSFPVTEGLPPGCYVIEAEKGGKRVSTKIMIPSDNRP